MPKLPAHVMATHVAMLSLGVETRGGVFARIMPRNTFFPGKKSVMFTTSHDNQTQATITILQGERRMAADNFLMGQLVLDISPQPRGVPQINVTFDVDNNCNCRVTAEERNSGLSQSITFEDLDITTAGELTSETIIQMLHDAEINAEADLLKQQIAESRQSNDLPTAIQSLTTSHTMPAPV